MLKKNENKTEIIIIMKEKREKLELNNGERRTNVKTTEECGERERKTHTRAPNAGRGASGI